MQHKQLITKGKSLSNVLLMDSGSTCHTACNKNFVVDIRPAAKPCELNTNNATSMMDVEATLPGLGDTYFDESHKANIMSLNKTTDTHFVQMLSWKKNAFWVQDKKYGKNGEPDWTKPYTEFEASDEGLYAMEPSDTFTDAVAKENNSKSAGVQQHFEVTMHNQDLLEEKDEFELNFLTYVEETTPEDMMEYQFLVETLSENRKFYTMREFKDAKRARALYHNSGYMTVDDFKKVISTPGQIINNPVTVQHVVMAEDLFGPSLSYWRGKNTRMKPKPIKYSTVAIPPEIKE